MNEMSDVSDLAYNNHSRYSRPILVGLLFLRTV